MKRGNKKKIKKNKIKKNPFYFGILLWRMIMLKKNLRECNDSDLKTNIDNMILDSFKEFHKEIEKFD